MTIFLEATKGLQRGWIYGTGTQGSSFCNLNIHKSSSSTNEQVELVRIELQQSAKDRELLKQQKEEIKSQKCIEINDKS